jgi:hypothetical protein
MKTVKRLIPQRGGAVQVILIILGALLALAFIAVAAGVWWAKRYVNVKVQEGDRGQRVEVRTPVGEVVVAKGEDAVQKLKLPIYPGAEPEDESVVLRLWGRVEDEEGGLNIAAAQFRTDDAMEKVDEWYHRQLGSGFTRKQGRIVGGNHGGDDWEIRVEPGGTDVLYKQESEGRLRGVVLKPEFTQIKIGLFEVIEARHQ